MGRGSVFITNKTQAVRFPKSVRLPEGVYAQGRRYWRLKRSGTAIQRQRRMPEAGGADFGGTAPPPRPLP